MMGNVFIAGATPLFGLFIRDFGITVSQASYLSSYALLAFGLAVRPQEKISCAS